LGGKTKVPATQTGGEKDRRRGKKKILRGGCQEKYKDWGRRFTRKCEVSEQRERKGKDVGAPRGRGRLGREIRSLPTKHDTYGGGRRRSAGHGVA